jgi:hypothetical protein
MAVFESGAAVITANHFFSDFWRYSGRPLMAAAGLAFGHRRASFCPRLSISPDNAFTIESSDGMRDWGRRSNCRRRVGIVAAPARGESNDVY